MTTTFYKKDDKDWCRMVLEDKTVIDVPTEKALDIVAGISIFLFGLLLLAILANSKLKSN